jgi:hypothetical protein
MDIIFCNKTVECPETPMAFDRTEYGKLLAIQARLAEPKALTPNERRDLAVAMQTVLHSAVRLDRPAPDQPDVPDQRGAPARPKRNWDRFNPDNEIVIAARQAHDLFARKIG